MPENALYCGDNLDVLRGLPAGSVQLVYLDPPFNTGRDWYFNPVRGSREQVLAFTDAWKWAADAAQQYKELTAQDGTLAAFLDWFRDILGETGALAYLVHMTARFGELHRVLDPAAGGLFLHVDDTMSHYLKILLDQVFGEGNFAGQIIWKRTSAHNNAKGFARVHDVILVYRRGPAAPWCDPDGWVDTGGHGDVWLDIPPVNGQARERTGYPTQKPLPLLTRIITLASEPGDVLLDPNCGSGTSVTAAQLAGRRWIGIDLSPAAIALTQERLRACGAVDYQVRDAPVLEHADGQLF